MKIQNQIILDKADSVSAVTRKVIENFNLMSDAEFMMKYQVTKLRYLKRVIKYGDPYMHAPLAKLGKFLERVMAK